MNLPGAFADWQPEYARHGIPTFPVKQDKTPAIKNYLSIELGGSLRLLPRFASYTAFGISLGPRTGITVLDIDIADERLLEHCLRSCGETPIVIRTASGNFQAWYRHNGEKRGIRPYPELPIDILGAGFVVAPPSRIGDQQYQFVQGSLADLGQLPTMQDSSFRRLIPNPRQLPIGSRNNALFRFALKQAHYVDDPEALLDKVESENDNLCEVQLRSDEVRKIVSSAWKYQVQGRNFANNKYVALMHREIDQLAAGNPDALALLTLLRRLHHGRSEFALAKAIARTRLKWTVPRFKRARLTLEELGFIQCLHRGGKGRADPPKYCLTATARFDRSC